MKHSLNKWPLVISILIVCTVVDSVSRAIFCIYMAVHAIILHKTYMDFLADKKQIEMKVFENKLNEIVDKIHNEFNVTINRFINLK